MKSFQLRFVLLILLFVLHTTVSAQENAAADPDTDRMEALTKKLTDTIEEFRKIVREAQTLGFKFVNAETADDAFPFSEPFYEKLEEGNKIRDRIVPLAIELFELKVAGTDRAEDELVHLVSNIAARFYDQHQYAKAYRLTKKLVLNNPDNQFAKVYLARSGLLTNDFSSRVQAIIKNNQKYFEENENVSATEKLLANNVAVMNQLYEKELKIREAEAVADDLPRVKFTTTKGEFVVELFENEAPQTVANFVHLVEAGHYDGMFFHLVIGEIAAETGVVAEKDGVRQLDYTIHDEYEKPNARLNFSGSVTLNSDSPNSGASRFFVSLASLPNFNNKQTVFGRVFSGMDTVYSLNHTYKIQDKQQIQIEGVKPDKVISAEVIRKRNHKYEPTKFIKTTD